MSPNIIAYCALFGWPLVVFVLFRLLPRPNAAIWSILAGYLLLPPNFGIDFALVPTIDKVLIPSVFTAIAAWLFKDKVNDAVIGSPRSVSKPLIVLLLVFFLGPFLTAYNNTEPIVLPGIYIPGIRLYDVFGGINLLIITVLPYLIGRKLLAREELHSMLLRAFVWAGLVYSFLILIEVRLSPQLNTWVYGYFAHSFGQHIRNGGFRPIVFLNHGLWVGLFIATATLAAASMWKQSERNLENLIWLLLTFWLFFILYLSKTLGAFILTGLFLPVVLFTSGRAQRLVAGAVAVAVLLYPVLRSADLVPIETVYEIALSIDEDRANSFKFRIDNEDALLARALEKPIAGWGLWGRSNIFDPETGENVSILDGAWIITLGSFGWLGYIAQFGMLCLPLLILARKHPQAVSLSTSGLCILLVVNLIDLIPNATLTPLTFLTAGSLMGFCEHLSRSKNLQKTSRSSTDTTLFRGPHVQRQRRQ